MSIVLVCLGTLSVIAVTEFESTVQQKSFDSCNSSMYIVHAIITR